MRNMTQNSPHLLSTTAGVSGRNLTLPPQDFIRCDIGRKGHLDEYEAMILMEDREIVITAPELREMIQSADLICSHKLIFIEWCCAYFKKSYKGLPQYENQDARNAAISAAKIASDAAKKLEEDIISPKQRESLKHNNELKCWLKNSN
mmetsp:Transcript_32820/g.44995  ORF Transcript_32820/g.44995 Transcript_32820/m.44995 type:complete len:148 (+) Transcript_32820:174-617(+)